MYRNKDNLFRISIMINVTTNRHYKNNNTIHRFQVAFGIGIDLFRIVQMKPRMSVYLINNYFDNYYSIQDLPAIKFSNTKKNIKLLNDDTQLFFMPQTIVMHY